MRYFPACAWWSDTFGGYMSITGFISCTFSWEENCQLEYWNWMWNKIILCRNEKWTIGLFEGYLTRHFTLVALKDSSLLLSLLIEECPAHLVLKWVVCVLKYLSVFWALTPWPNPQCLARLEHAWRRFLSLMSSSNKVTER